MNENIKSDDRLIFRLLVVFQESIQTKFVRQHHNSAKLKSQLSKSLDFAASRMGTRPLTFLADSRLKKVDFLEQSTSLGTQSTNEYVWHMK